MPLDLPQKRQSPAYDMNGNVLLNPAAPSRVGTNPLAGKDANGKAFHADRTRRAAPFGLPGLKSVCSEDRSAGRLRRAEPHDPARHAGLATYRLGPTRLPAGVNNRNYAPTLDHYQRSLRLLSHRRVTLFRLP